jgi:hypothetical protein
MTKEPEAPLGPPPRKAHVRRGVRNMHRAYGTIFLLLIAVFGGWAALDAWHWADLSEDRRVLTIGFAIAAVLALAIYRFVGHPLRLELRLARRGEIAVGQIVAIEKKRRRRAALQLTYTFRTSQGMTMNGSWRLPRRFPAETLAPGMELEILYDPKKPRLNKPRIGLEYVEFKS